MDEIQVKLENSNAFILSEEGRLKIIIAENT